MLGAFQIAIQGAFYGTFSVILSLSV